MGAEQSSSRNGGGGQDDRPLKRDYYEVLEIERQATDDEYTLRYCCRITTRSNLFAESRKPTEEEP